MNHALIAAIWAMLLAQWLKAPIMYFKSGKWNWPIIFSTGSMPSSHSSFVVALAMGVGLNEGFDTSVFAVACVFAMITVHDAIKVRGESGKQAKVINDLVSDLSTLYETLNIKEQKERQKKLKELIGHTTTEVVGGVILGLFVATIYFYFI